MSISFCQVAIRSYLFCISNTTSHCLQYTQILRAIYTRLLCLTITSSYDTQFLLIVCADNTAPDDLPDAIMIHINSPHSVRKLNSNVQYQNNNPHTFVGLCCTGEGLISWAQPVFSVCWYGHKTTVSWSRKLVDRNISTQLGNRKIISTGKLIDSVNGFVQFFTDPFSTVYGYLSTWVEELSMTSSLNNTVLWRDSDMWWNMLQLITKLNVLGTLNEHKGVEILEILESILGAYLIQTYIQTRIHKYIPYSGFFITASKNFCIFHTGYFDYTVAFQILLDLYWLVTSWMQLAMKRNGYF